LSGVFQNMMLTIWLEDGNTREVKALKIGPLAVHRNYLFAFDQFRVTHIRSGLGIPGGRCCKASAIGLAKALIKALPKGAWNFDIPISERVAPIKVPKDVRAARAIAKSWKCPKGCNFQH
jgi:hypothetical protein